MQDPPEGKLPGDFLRSKTNVIPDERSESRDDREMGGRKDHP